VARTAQNLGLKDDSKSKVRQHLKIRRQRTEQTTTSPCVHRVDTMFGSYVYKLGQLSSCMRHTGEKVPRANTCVSFENSGAKAKSKRTFNEIDLEQAAFLRRGRRDITLPFTKRFGQKFEKKQPELVSI